jgi:hypothetical protein
MFGFDSDSRPPEALEIGHSRANSSFSLNIVTSSD